MNSGVNAFNVPIADEMCRLTKLEIGKFTRNI